MPVVASLDFMHDKHLHWQSNFCALKLLSIVLLNKSLKHIETNNIKSVKRVMDWDNFNGASQYYGSLCVHLVFDLIVEITNRLHFILPTLKCLVNSYNTMYYVLTRAPSTCLRKYFFWLFLLSKRITPLLSEAELISEKMDILKQESYLWVEVIQILLESTFRLFSL